MLEKHTAYLKIASTPDKMTFLFYFLSDLNSLVPFPDKIKLYSLNFQKELSLPPFLPACPVLLPPACHLIEVCLLNLLLNTNETRIKLDLA